MKDYTLWQYLASWYIVTGVLAYVLHWQVSPILWCIPIGGFILGEILGKVMVHILKLW